jgi:hypothetical protein
MPGHEMARTACGHPFGAMLNDLWDSAVLLWKPVGWIGEIVDLSRGESLAAARYLDWSGALLTTWLYLVRKRERPTGRLNSRTYFGERKNRTQSEYPDPHRLPHKIPPELFMRLNRRRSKCTTKAFDEIHSFELDRSRPFVASPATANTLNP